MLRLQLRRISVASSIGDDYVNQAINQSAMKLLLASLFIQWKIQLLPVGSSELYQKRHFQTPEENSSHCKGTSCRLELISLPAVRPEGSAGSNVTRRHSSVLYLLPS
jgi:hypothetical protein